jgi:hypothetical protein
MQFRLDEGNPIEQLLDHCVLVLVELLRDRGQFGVGLLVYGGLDALSVSCVLQTARISVKPQADKIDTYRCLIRLEFSLFLSFVSFNLLGCLQMSILKPLGAICTVR